MMDMPRRSRLRVMGASLAMALFALMPKGLETLRGRPPSRPFQPSLVGFRAVSTHGCPARGAPTGAAAAKRAARKRRNIMARAPK